MFMRFSLFTEGEGEGGVGDLDGELRGQSCRRIPLPEWMGSRVYR